jgi:hypothetical protein
MKAIAILAATAALVTLAGCDRLRGGGGANTSANAATPAPAAGNQAQGADAGGKPADGGGAIPASSTGGPVQLDRTFVMGRWTDDGDCSNAIEFTQDGRFITAEGGTGLWNLERDELTMTGQQTATIRISPIDQNTMTVINADGSLGRSTRC